MIRAREPQETLQVEQATEAETRRVAVVVEQESDVRSFKFVGIEANGS